MGDTENESQWSNRISLKTVAVVGLLAGMTFGTINHRFAENKSEVLKNKNSREHTKAKELPKNIQKVLDKRFFSF